jgi:alpha-2-macroglobulin
MTRNKSIFLLALPFFIIASALLLSSCKQDRRAQKMPESVSDYVYGYTSGTVSKSAPIRVRFASIAADEAEIGQATKGNIISFTPAIKGSAKWEDAQTLRFEPAEPLQSGKTYIAKVNLKSIFPDVPSEAESFEFDFYIREQYFEIAIDGLEAPDFSDLSKQEVKGSLFTADIAAEESVMKLLSARQNGRQLNIRWDHSADGIEHYFTVEGVARGEKASKVSLKWDGSPLSINLKGSEEVEIPALGDFKVTSARVVQGQEQYILLHFSDPLLEAQDLNGLVSLDGYGSSLRFLIDGNKLRLYPTQRIAGDYRVKVSPGLRNFNNKRMAAASIWDISINSAMPEVRLVGRGVIIPDSEGLIFPFEAVSLNAVEVEVFKIYHNNILQFLQTNDLDGGYYDLHQVGRIIMQKKVPLASLNPNASTSQWTRYALDLSKMIAKDDQAIYQIRIGYRPEYTTYFCAGSDSGQAENESLQRTDNAAVSDEVESIMDSWYGINGYYPGYSWADRDNPCSPAYYNSDRFVKRNVIASNLGLIAKGGADNNFFISVADLRTTRSISGAKLEFFDYQQQLLGTSTTNDKGSAEVKLPRKPYVVIARQGSQRGYLRLDDGTSLSMSRFDVAGVAPQKGLKGFLYGDRGVWRPGDSVYLNFVLEDLQGKLPPNYPIAFELRDPRGQLQEKRSISTNVNFVYAAHFATSPDAPTGSWMATVKAGGATFEKALLIETVKPNRIKITLDFGKSALSTADEPIRASLQADWLHGAPARGLRAVVEAQLRSIKTEFKGYGNFAFDDPARSFSSEPAAAFDGMLNDEGRAALSFRLSNSQLMPGRLSAAFKTTVFEKGGDFSTDSYSIPYDPYEAYAGIQIPQNKYGEPRFNLNERGTINFVALNKTGQPLSNRKLSVGIYRVEWRWWWDNGYDYVSRYNTSSHYDAIERKEISTNGKGEAAWAFTAEEWGRYLVRVCDTESGHCSGSYFYAGYPWYGEDSDAHKQAAAMLSLSTDKPKYQVGETVKLTLPTGEVGRALVTLENGARVVESFWVEAKAGENVFSFKASAEMAPNVYAHVALIQPHAQAMNDLPIRMYGVIPVNVENPASRLAPKLKVADELKPEQTFAVEVSETNGKPMAYTLAVVDEGLLGLTRFKTPNPWDAFFAREALGVRTWDVYDHVLGAYGAELERLLSIGGDGEIDRGAQDDRANRFKPVVMHLGPFELKKGKTAKHELKMPNYVGAVRVMVVASSPGAYGSAEKSVPVRQPLMLLATLPRVLSPGERLKVPVNVFAMDKKVRSANISIQEKSGLVKIIGPNSQTLQFSGPGDQLAFFEVEVSQTVGVARFTISGSGNGESAKQEIELQVRNPNPYVTDVDSKALDAGQSHTFNFKPPGMVGTNEAILEVSSIPPINLGQRLQYLLGYPYGCLEQTLSGGFPQLFVRQLMELDESQKKQVPKNIQATIERLKQFQTSQGGFASWPGNSDPSHWSTNYAGHFMLEAQALGYTVPPSLLEKWAEFQKKTARMWDGKQASMGFYSQSSHELMQAYRLYTLALAKQPDLAAMNRLREYDGLSVQAKWRLAAAYALAGKSEVAKQITNKLTTQVASYRETGHTFGSELRDRAMILETLVLLNQREAAAELLRYISDELSSQGWYSTQEISYSLLAIGKYVGGAEASHKPAFTYQLADGKAVNAGSNSPVMQINIPLNGNGQQQVMVKNTSKSPLFTRVIRRGQPLAGEETASAQNLKIEVLYKTLEGAAVNPAALIQGTNFVAEVRVTHTGQRPFPYQELALAQIFPSGWEIINTRMDELESSQAGNRPKYLDIRDDRANTFFDLPERKTQVYRIQLNAAYQGHFYLPAVSCEAMYDNSIYARVPGTWVEVRTPTES